MNLLTDIELPEDLEICSYEKNKNGESNHVYLCDGRYRGEKINFYVKISKGSSENLANEREILTELKDTEIPVPQIIWYEKNKPEILVIEVLKGNLLWDFIDPRREQYNQELAEKCLYHYGKYLGLLHGLPLKWQKQKRYFLYDFIGEKEIQDHRLQEIAAWLDTNRPEKFDPVFVHGDYNTANVLYDNGCVSGIIDWEFAGNGFREYDLAWALRARLSFLNTLNERKAILDGYSEIASYNEMNLKWCEVMNYLHFAYWSYKNQTTYFQFACEYALKLINKSHIPINDREF